MTNIFCEMVIQECCSRSLYDVSIKGSGRVDVLRKRSQSESSLFIYSTISLQRACIFICSTELNRMNKYPPFLKPCIENCYCQRLFFGNSWLHKQVLEVVLPFKRRRGFGFLDFFLREYFA